MADLPQLTGDFVKWDNTVVSPSGQDFWKVCSVASGFSGDAGRPPLGILIHTLSPKPFDGFDL